MDTKKILLLLLGTSNSYLALYIAPLSVLSETKNGYFLLPRPLKEKFKENFVLFASREEAQQIKNRTRWTLTQDPLFYLTLALSHIGPTAILYEDTTLERSKHCIMNGIRVLFIRSDKYAELRSLAADAPDGFLIDDGPANIFHLLPLEKTGPIFIEFFLLLSLCVSIAVFLYVCTEYMLDDGWEAIRPQTDPRRVRQLKTRSYRNGSADARWPTCTICLSDFENGDAMRVLPCTHTFHTNCIDPWLENRFRWCPICRKEAYSMDGSIFKAFAAKIFDKLQHIFPRHQRQTPQQ